LRKRGTGVSPGTSGLAIAMAYENPTCIDSPRFRALTPPDIYADMRRSLTRLDRLAFPGQVRWLVVDEPTTTARVTPQGGR
jgi:hypothetical protein